MPSSPLLTNPRVQAWLALIRHAEGTGKNKNPYGVAFTGAQFDNNRPHPAIVRGSPGGYRSDASGAYQFLSSTWKGVNGGKNVPMTKENQDLAAIKLMQRRGVDPTQPLSRSLLAKLAPEWASLPTMAGMSFYGQPVKKFEELVKVYQQFEKGYVPQSQQPQPQPMDASRPQWQNDLQIPQIVPTQTTQRFSPAELINNAVQSLGINNNQ